ARPRRRLFGRLFYTRDSGGSVLELCRYGVGGAVPAHLLDWTEPLMRKVVLSWLALLALLALEIGASLLPLSPTARPLILVPALVMLGFILTGFMEVGRAPVLARLFFA